MGIATIPTKNALQTTLASSLSAGETGSLSVSDDLSSFLSDASTSRPFWIVVDRIDANGTKTPTTREYIKVTGVSGTTWSGLTRGQGGSTGQAHSAGAIVELVVDADTIKSITDTFLVQHASDGTHSFSGTVTVAGTDTDSAGIRFAEDTDNGTNYMGLKAPAAVTTSTDLVLPDGDGTAGQALLTDGAGNLEWGSGGLISTTQYAPEGFLINGKIVPSVASNNLTVAIKGMDGNDPSASNPVYVRIGDTVHTITSALSVTKNAGTNWCNAGSSELATKEIDYFVYLGYNATDGVVIGFSRTPYGTLYSDFSTTTTNEKYCAISTITNAATGDNYVNIGRFAATLSAGAGYTWTVPTFTNTNLIQRPIYETRALAWVPTNTYGGGTADPLSVSTNSYYKITGDQCYITEWRYSADPGTGARTTLSFTLPMSIRGSNRTTLASLNVNNATHTWCSVRVITTTVYIQTLSMTDNVGWELYLSGTYGI